MVGLAQTKAQRQEAAGPVGGTLYLLTDIHERCHRNEFRTCLTMPRTLFHVAFGSVCFEEEWRQLCGRSQDQCYVSTGQLSWEHRSSLVLWTDCHPWSRIHLWLTFSFVSRHKISKRSSAANHIFQCASCRSATSLWLGSLILAWWHYPKCTGCPPSLPWVHTTAQPDVSSRRPPKETAELSSDHSLAMRVWTS